MNCPHCDCALTEEQLVGLLGPKKIRSLAAALNGAAGEGAAKARTPEQAAAAARKRWDNYRKARSGRPATNGRRRLRGSEAATVNRVKTSVQCPVGRGDAIPESEHTTGVSGTIGL